MTTHLEAETKPQAHVLPPAVKKVEHPAERLTSLRQALDELPELERLIVVLYYAGNFSPAKIGTELSLSCQAVARKLNCTVEALQSRLAPAGLAATAPCLTQDELLDAILTACAPAPSPGLYEKIVHRIKALDSEAGPEEQKQKAEQAGFLKKVLFAAGEFVVQKKERLLPADHAPVKTPSPSAPEPLSSTPPPPTSPRDFKALPLVPGWPLVGNLFQLKHKRVHCILEDCARNLGGFFRVRVANQHALVLSDPQGIQQVLKERPVTFRRLKTVESVMKDMGVTGVLSAEGEDWKRQSRLIFQAFNPAHLRGFFPQVARVTQRLRRRWQQAAQVSASLDLQGELNRFALDVTAGLALGCEINTLEGDDAVVRQLNRVFPKIHRRINTPLPYWRYFKLPADRAFDRDLRTLHQAIHGFIQQARARMEANPQLREHPANLIEALVAARDQPHSGFTDEDVFGNVFSALLAGAEGTANTIAWVVHFLCEHPDWQDKLQQEADLLLAGQPQMLSFEQLSRAMPILEAVIQESMRLKPVFPILLHQANVPAVIGNVRVPEGTPIVLLMRAAGLDPQNFPHPERFDPARWMEPANEGESANMRKRLLLPFGSGPRMCPGRLLGMQQLKLVVTMLLRNFTVSFSCQNPVEEELRFTMQPVNLRVALKARSKPTPQPLPSREGEQH